MGEPDRIEQLFEHFTRQFTQTFTQQFKQTLTAVMQEQRELIRNEHRVENPLDLGARVINELQNHQTGDYIRKTKVNFSKFESGDPTEWLYKVNKYFDYHKIAEIYKLSLVRSITLGWGCFKLVPVDGDQSPDQIMG